MAWVCPVARCQRGSRVTGLCQVAWNGSDGTARLKQKVASDVCMFDIRGVDMETFTVTLCGLVVLLTP